MAESIVAAKNMAGESPVWHPEHGSVYWTDINGFAIQRLKLSDGSVSKWKFDGPVTAISLTTEPEWLLAAVGGRLIFWKPANDQRVPFVEVEADWPAHRLNDGASDANGNFWVGSMRNNVGPNGEQLDVAGDTGSLYRVTPSGEVTVWATGIGIVNTVAWSPDGGTFYTGCSIANVIWEYAFDAARSSIARRRDFFAGMNRGCPDGSAVDAEGFIWNCRFFGGCIVRVAPDGKVDRVLEMPVSNLTHCTFGGENLDTLYVTSASVALHQDEPLAGNLFRVHADEVGVRGLPPKKFRMSVK